MNVPKLRFKDDDGQDFPEWEEKTLADIAVFYDSKRIPLKESERAGKSGEFPYYGASGIIDYIDKYIFDGEYVLLSEDGANITARNSRVAFLVNGKFWVNNHAHVIQAKGSNLFLAELLESINYNQYNTGTVQPKLNIESCKKIILNIPCYSEQTKIANFLMVVDEKIAQLTRKCELLARYKKGVMQQLFSQELRFKDEGDRDFPEWEESTVGDIISQKSEKFNPEKLKHNLKCIELEHLSQETGELLGYTDVQKQKSIKNKFKKGDVLFGKLRPYLKKFLKAPFDGVCSSEIWVLTGKKEKVSNDFVYQFVQTENFITITNISSGSKMPRSDWSIVASSKVMYPSAKEQTKITNLLTAIDEKITQTQTYLQTVKRYKQGLLQQMFI